MPRTKSEPKETWECKKCPFIYQSPLEGLLEVWHWVNHERHNLKKVKK